MPYVPLQRSFKDDCSDCRTKQADEQKAELQCRTEEVATMQATVKEQKAKLKCCTEEVAKLQARIDQQKAQLQCRTKDVAKLQAQQKANSQCHTEEVAKLQARVNFLSQPFHNKNEDGPTRTHVSIVVQDREDEMLHAHQFILVSFHPIL
jgi:septal ring factor EnvC (AmiA/AmiB activator)